MHVYLGVEVQVVILVLVLSDTHVFPWQSFAPYYSIPSGSIFLQIFVWHLDSPKHVKLAMGTGSKRPRRGFPTIKPQKIQRHF